MMAMQWLAEETKMDNAMFQRWMKECHTLKYPQAGFILCCFEAMQWLAEATKMDNAMFQR